MALTAVSPQGVLVYVVQCSLSCKPRLPGGDSGAGASVAAFSVGKWAQICLVLSPMSFPFTILPLKMLLVQRTLLFLFLLYWALPNSARLSELWFVNRVARFSWAEKKTTSGCSFTF